MRPATRARTRPPSNGGPRLARTRYTRRAASQRLQLSPFNVRQAMMSGPARPLLSFDDLASGLGYVGLVVLGSSVNRDVSIFAFSLLASGMLVIFWLASDAVRSRNSHPAARVALWAVVAVASGLMLLRG